MYSRARTLRMLGVVDDTHTPISPSHPSSAPPARATWSRALLGAHGGVGVLVMLSGRVWGGVDGAGRRSWRVRKETGALRAEGVWVWVWVWVWGEVEWELWVVGAVKEGVLYVEG
jgi:hypothetical protein